MKCAALIVLLTLTSASATTLPWLYKCDSAHDRCVKFKVADKDVENDISFHGEDLMSFAKCKLTCRYDDEVAQQKSSDPDEGHFSILWPRPREVLALGDDITHFELDHIQFQNENDFKASPTGQMLKRNIKEQTKWLLKKKRTKAPTTPQGVLVSITILMDSNSHSDDKPIIWKDVDEKYSLRVQYQQNEKNVAVNIKAMTYFGARHGIETLFQLIEYDDIEKAFAIVNDVNIVDYPAFPHRGASLDTSRNFIYPDVLKRIIDGLAHAKLNVFHWHITDTHSFPMELKGDDVAKITEYGAYSKDQIYTQDIIKEIVDYANYRGVRVIPELDQPSHVGNGWNFPGGEDLTVCTNTEPWYDFCYEPPCGQLDPTQPRVYDLLEKIYVEMVDMFNFDQFHMGADEVQFRCWNTSDHIKKWLKDHGKKNDEQGFTDIWRDFQEKSSSLLQKVFGPKHLDIIVWTSHLTKGDYIETGLPRDRYIVQIWSNASDTSNKQINELVEKGYRMIFSNVDALYADCGFGAWVGTGNNWCTPYKEWQRMYKNDFYILLQERGINLTDEVKKLVLGGEIAMWTEQADSNTIEARLFPRASALAERLWSNPGQNWYKAQSRLLHHRSRLVQRGVRADTIQPQWCEQNERMCYAPANNPVNEQSGGT